MYSTAVKTVLMILARCYRNGAAAVNGVTPVICFTAITGVTAVTCVTADNDVTAYKSVTAKNGVTAINCVTAAYITSSVRSTIQNCYNGL